MIPHNQKTKCCRTEIFSAIQGSNCFHLLCQPFHHRSTQQDILNAMGSMYAAVLFIGITNSSFGQPVVFVERFVSYRERAAGMYSALPFAFAQAWHLYILRLLFHMAPCKTWSANDGFTCLNWITLLSSQVTIEFPYVVIQTLIYSTIFYFMASFEWNVWKFIWYIYFMYFHISILHFLRYDGNFSLSKP